MKRMLLFLGILTGFLVLKSCTHELKESPPPLEQEGYKRFGVKSARSYFEANATDLSFMNISGHSISTRNGKGVSEELVPDWSRAVQSANEEVSLVEVPILSGTTILPQVKNFEDGECVLSKYLVGVCRLMVARHKDGRTDMFVVTLVPSVKYNTGRRSMENFRYLGGSSFTGKVFASTLDGQLVEASQYIDGKFVGRLQVSTRKRLQEAEVDYPDSDYETVAFLHTRTSGAAYTFIEGDGGGGTPPRCQWHPAYPAASCPYCLEEVVVNYCPECHSRLEEGEICNCRCPWCDSYPCRCCTYCWREPCVCKSSCPVCRPDTCTRCSNCGLHFCLGNCSGIGAGGEAGEDGKENCPYGKCHDNPCSCCAVCKGPCVKCTGVHCPRCHGYILPPGVSRVPTRSGMLPGHESPHCSNRPCECCLCKICGEEKCKEVHPKKAGERESKMIEQADSNHLMIQGIDSFQYHNRTYPSYKDFLAHMWANLDIEHSISITYYPEEGFHLIGEIVSGNTSNVTIYGRTQGVVASVHSHPFNNPTPPSWQDLITTAECASENPDFDYLYTYAGNDTYVFYVEDREKAAAFHAKYKNTVNKKTNMIAEGNKLYNDWDYAQDKLSKLSKKEEHLWGLAYVLQKNDSGIGLMRQKEDETNFSILKTEYTENGTITPLEYKK